jgi:hypothetical protein
MSKEIMVFCDFCSGGFEMKSKRLDEIEKEAALRKREGVYDEDDEFFMTICPECRAMLNKLDGGSDKAAEYFTRFLVDGLTLKNAYRILIRRADFRLGLASYAARLRAKPSQRQDGKRGVKLSFKEGAAGSGTVMPAMVFGIDIDALKRGGGKEP